MNQDFQKAHDMFVEKMGFLSTLFGFSKLVGQIYATLYLSPKPLCLNDIMNMLHVSKGSISVNVRELEKWGGCKKVWVKGERRDYYEAEIDFRNIVNKRLMDAIKRRISVIGDISEDTHSAIKEIGKNGSREDKELFAFYQKRMQRISKAKDAIGMIIKTVDKLI